MTPFSAAGFPIIEAVITLVRAGRWSVDLAIDAPSADGLEGASITLELGGKLQLQGTVRRAGEFVGCVKLEVVGGRAGLLRELAPKAFQAVTLQLVLQDALAGVGEQLAGDSDASVLAVALPKWTRIRATAAEELASLLGAAPAGAVARVKPDGSVWVGVDTYPDAGLADGSYELLRDDHHSGVAELGVEVPSLLPGTTFLGRQVEEVTHLVQDDRVRTTVQFARAADPSRETDSSSHSAELDEIILRRLRPHRFHRLFPARVVTQNADGTLELQPDDTDTMPGLSRVPIRTPAPEVSLTVAPNSRCAVQFEAGDPQRPVVAMFESGTLLELKLGGSAAVGRVGDDVGANAALLAWMTAVQVSLNSLGFPVAPPFPTVPGTPIGSIVAGSNKVKA